MLPLHSFLLSVLSPERFRNSENSTVGHGRHRPDNPRAVPVSGHKAPGQIPGGDQSPVDPTEISMLFSIRLRFRCIVSLFQKHLKALPYHGTAHNQLAGRLFFIRLQRPRHLLKNIIFLKNIKSIFA